MSDQLLTDPKLSELEQRATDRLLMSDVFDEKAFGELLAYLSQRAEQIRVQPSVPKQYLNAILKAVGSIRSRAEYLPHVRSHLPTATELETLLGLVAAGESPSARKPGVPRII